MRLPHVLWIGGPPGAGKTTLARRIAHRHDLRAYNADAHTYEHHDRSLAAGDAEAARWESLSPDERWLGTEAEEMAAFSLRLNAERCRHMVDDLAVLPRSPLVVVEGTPLLPWLVDPLLASPAHAVWLVPTPSFQRAKLLERPRLTFAATSDPDRALENRLERERLVGAAIEQAAHERGLPVVRVDENRDLDAVERLVEAALEDALANGPRAATTDERAAMRRAENDTLAAQVRTHLARTPGAPPPDRVTLPFDCECGRGGCDLQVDASVDGIESARAAGAPVVHADHA